MTRALVLDTTAFEVLAGPDTAAQRRLRAALTVAQRDDRDVIVPALVLAVLSSSLGHSALLDSCLSLEAGFVIRATDRPLARMVGKVLARAGAQLDHIVDAHVVAAAVECGGGTILTTDDAELCRLSMAFRGVRVVSLRS